MAMIETTLTTRQIDLAGLLGALFTRRAAPGVTDREDAADTRARRDFLCDMLDRNSDAFRSEADIHFMMSVYPGRF